MRGNTLVVQYTGTGWRKGEDWGVAGAKEYTKLDQIAEELIEGKKDYPKGVKIGTTLIIKLRKD